MKTDEICDKQYRLARYFAAVGENRTVWMDCNRDAGHETSDDESYREHGHEDRTPF